MHLHYILDEQGNPVPEPDVLKFATWFETSGEKRRVAETFFGDIRVSTIFLGLVSPGKYGEDMLYETMVFAREPVLARLLELSETDDRSIIAQFVGAIDIQKRYRTKEEAVEGHKRMCIFIETCVTTGLIHRGGNIDDTDTGPDSLH